MTNLPMDDAAPMRARVRTPVGVRKKSSGGEKVLFIMIGIGGDGHPGGGIDLADSLLLVSLQPSTKKAALISIPRDFYLQMGHYGTHRLNDAHALGANVGYPGGGPGMVIDEVKAITGQPINGYVRLDFKAFEKIVDDLGGVDIYVYRPFHDTLFKDTFQQGWQHMNGHRALQYARYRYVIGLEGNNFARELRQQQIVSAVRKKMQHLTPTQALRLAMSASSVSHYTKTNLSTPPAKQSVRATATTDRSEPPSRTSSTTRAPSSPRDRSSSPTTARHSRRCTPATTR